METRYLKTLVVALEAGSFSRAAEILHITQSAVSQRIKFMEEQYGAILVDRSGPALAPTTAGLVVLRNARGILDSERELMEELKRLGEQKRLSLCCTPTFGMAFLPRVLNLFLRQNSDLSDLKFVFHQPHRALKGLQEKEFNLAVIEHCFGMEFSPYHVHALPQDELVFISSPSLEIPPGIVTVDAVLPHRLYARQDGCSSKELLKNNLASMGVGLADFRGVVISDDLRLTVDTVLAGDGISFVSLSLVQEHIQCGRLRSHHIQGFEHFRARSIVLPLPSLQEPLVRTFVECAVLVAETIASPAPGIPGQEKAGKEVTSDRLVSRKEALG